MIDSTSAVAAQQLFRNNMLEHAKLKQTQFPKEFTIPTQTPGVTGPKSDEPFDNVIGNLVKDVDAKAKASVAETNKVLLGQTDNIHQSMIAMQEAGMAFSLMVEVRNKLVQSYQELMKMPV